MLPKSLQEADFQDLDLWREFNYKILSYMVRNHSGPLIVPMTLVNTEYFDSIVGALREDGIKVIHFTLAASRETILERLSKRGEDENSWAARQFNRCTKGLADKRYEQIINTDNLMINEIITKIMDSIKFENEDKDIN